MANEYKRTTNLPRTDFPMRASLAQNEPKRLAAWEGEGVYELLLKKNEGHEKFVLHDGPPYANGPIHLGHAQNKISKDIINRYWAMPGCPSRSACARLIEEGHVTINSTSALSKSERVALGDRVSVELSEPVCEGPLAPNPDIALDIRYEDDRLIVLSKQAGLVCHPSPGHVEDSLANALVARCGYDHLGLLQGEDRPGIVHRLDMIEAAGLGVGVANVADDTRSACDYVCEADNDAGAVGEAIERFVLRG